MSDEPLRFYCGSGSPPAWKVWLALEVGAGLEQSLGGNLGLGVDVRYVYGLNDVRNTASAESLKMRDLRVVAGLKIGL